jgi:hypothetical protein
MKKFSVFEYLYRNASNYKSWGTLVLRGEATASDLGVLKSKFESGEFSSPSNSVFRRFTLSFGNSVTAPALMITLGIVSTNCDRQQTKT